MSNKYPTVRRIKHALNELEIKHTQEAIKLKGLRTVLYMYINHTAQRFITPAKRKTAQVHAHRQLLSSKYAKGNRILSETLPEQYHENFTQAINEYIH